MIALDPKEGPTSWARQDVKENHIINLIIGADPNNPLNTEAITVNELENLHQWASENIEEYDG